MNIKNILFLKLFVAIFFGSSMAHSASSLRKNKQVKDKMALVMIVSELSYSPFISNIGVGRY